MYDAFVRLLNMSFEASVIVLVIVVLRLLLKKAPKRIVCVLWALVALRLILPFSIPSKLSAYNLTATPVNAQGQSEVFRYNGKSEKPLVEFTVPDISDAGFSSGNAAGDEHTPDMYLPTAVCIWLAGVCVMLTYAAVSYLRLRKKVAASIPLRGRLRLCDDISSPFIFGIVKPVIYIPSGLDEETLSYVEAHENAHTARYDHLWKPLGFLLLAIYWFDPVLWLAYILLCRDIEAACDEKVIRDMDNAGKAAYSQALLNCSFPRRRIAACPLAFGEVGVKSRVKSVLNYKKPAFWLVTAAVIACVAVAVCFLTSPKVINPENFPPIHLHSYTVAELAYERSDANYPMAALQNAPVYTVTDDMQLMSKGEYSPEYGWTNLGSLSEIGLTKENFDELFSGNGKWLDNNKNAAYFRKNNANAWAVIYQQDILYYVLQQKNGEMLLARGYNDRSENGDPYSDDSGIWRLYRLSFDIHEDTGNIVTSGENVTHVVVFPSDTPIADIKDRLYWIDISPDPDTFTPFQMFCDGHEISGLYSIYDAETLEALDFFTPSGLSPQTYLFQSAQAGRDYIVTMKISTDMYCFGARLSSDLSGDENNAVDRAASSDMPTDVYGCDLSVNGPFTASASVNATGKLMLPDYFRTNSTQISLINSGKEPVTVYLYSEADPDNAILQLSLDIGDRKGFTGLTSRYLYRIGISAGAYAEFEITIDD